MKIKRTRVSKLGKCDPLFRIKQSCTEYYREIDLDENVLNIIGNFGSPVKIQHFESLEKAERKIQRQKDKHRSINIIYIK